MWIFFGHLDTHLFGGRDMYTDKYLQKVLKDFKLGLQRVPSGPQSPAEAVAVKLIIFTSQPQAGQFLLDICHLPYHSGLPIIPSAVCLIKTARLFTSLSDVSHWSWCKQ